MVGFLGLAVLFASALAPKLASGQTTVTVQGTASHAIPETLWGLMFEDISHSGDGGLYGELLQNRAFQKVSPGTSAALKAWATVGSGSNISVVAASPAISSALPNALQVVVSGSNSGVSNAGYFGINVNSAWTYTGSFFYRFPTAPSGAVTATVGLRSAGGTVYASTTVSLKATTSWTQATFALKPSSSAGITNLFTVTFSGWTGTVNLGMFSLFPPTFKNQKNGMRMDISQALQDIKPSFFRLPGGNNLEGETAATRWQFNATLGSLTSRPGRVGGSVILSWGYVNTDGLGLYEYLVWVESAGMQPIMAVWAGYSLDGSSISQSGLAPYIEQARQQIEFAIGSASTPMGSLRASLGHPNPFTLNYVEVGNEDFLSQASGTYTYRWTAFTNALKADFPNIKFIATSHVNNPVLNPTPQCYDNHVYQTPTWFMQNSAQYDSYARNGQTYFEGEYAAISTNPNDLYGTPADGRLTYPTVASAVGEAAFMMGLERNSDIVFAASYAPLLGHITQNQWTPNLLPFDAGTVYKSTSYYVQQLFSVNRGDQYLPSTLASTSGTVFWSVVKSNSAKTFIIKVVNGGTGASSLVFQLPSAVKSSGTLVQLTGPATTSNTPSAPNAVVPKTSTITTAQELTFSAPAMSFSVITVPLS
ncbi:glycoside hydrolase family 51 protein [Peniophora sp. CONT]|nr:glycoside hydrolase family 51 protein [Peniophora sp. CONT]